MKRDWFVSKERTMLLKTAMCAILELGNRGLLPLIHVIARPQQGRGNLSTFRHCEPQQGRGNQIRGEIFLLDCRVVATPRNDS